MMSREEAFALLLPGLDTERPLLTADDLRTMLEESRAVLWQGNRSAIFTQVTAYHAVAEFVCEAGPAGGDMDEIMTMIPHIERWALQTGCTQALVHAGRSGWARKLEPLGYEHYQTVLRKVF